MPAHLVPISCCNLLRMYSDSLWNGLLANSPSYLNIRSSLTLVAHGSPSGARTYFTLDSWIDSVDGVWIVFADLGCITLNRGGPCTHSPKKIWGAIPPVLVTVVRIHSAVFAGIPGVMCRGFLRCRSEVPTIRYSRHNDLYFT